MKKKLSALLFGLVLTLALLTVTAWATESQTPPPPDKHAVKDLVGDITLQCEEQTNHNRCFDRLFSNHFTTTEVIQENETYTCTLTIQGKSLLEDFNSLQQYEGYKGHILSGEKTVSLPLTYKSGNWAVADPDFKKGSLVFRITCEEPAAPTMEELEPMSLQTRVSCNCCSNNNRYDVAHSALELSHGWSYWADSDNTWGYCIPFDPTDSLMRYNEDTPVKHLLKSDGHISLLYQNGAWTYESGFTSAAPAPTIKELNDMGLKIGVSCTGNKHAGKSDFVLSSADQLTFTLVQDEQSQSCWYQVSLTDAAASDFVKQYNSAIGTNHTKQSVTSVTMYWDYGGGGTTVLSLENSAVVQAEIVPPKKGWNLTSQAITVTAACTDGGNNIGPAKNPYVKEEPKTVTSAKTFDGGVALYAGLTLLSLTGTALTVCRKER